MVHDSNEATSLRSKNPSMTCLGSWLIRKSIPRTSMSRLHRIKSNQPREAKLQVMPTHHHRSHQSRQVHLYSVLQKCLLRWQQNILPRTLEAGIVLEILRPTGLQKICSWKSLKEITTSKLTPLNSVSVRNSSYIQQNHPRLVLRPHLSPSLEGLATLLIIRET